MTWTTWITQFLRGFEISRAFLREQRVGKNSGKFKNPVKVVLTLFSLSFLLQAVTEIVIFEKLEKYSFDK